MESSSSLAAWDEAAFRAVNSGLSGPLMDQVMLGVSSKWTWLAVGVVVVGYTLVRRHLRLLSFCILVGLAMGLSDGLAYQVLKPSLQRERPCHQLQDVRLVQDRCGSDFGFPSNHAANAMAVAVVAALAYPRRWKILAAFFGSALLVGLSRVYLGVHFPGDVLAGFAFGAVVGGVAYQLFQLSLGRWLPLKGRP